MRRNDSPAIVGGSHRLDHLGVVVAVLPPWCDADEVGGFDGFQTVLDHQVEPVLAAYASRPGGADLEIEDRVVVVGVILLAPHLAHRTQAECCSAVLNDHGDLLQRHAIIIAAEWQKINALWHYCHWWQECNSRRITAMITFMVTLFCCSRSGS